MAIRKTIQIGDKRLHTKSKCAGPRDKGVLRLIYDLRDTMKHEELIGMAAPQLGILKRVFVTEIRKTKTRKSGLDGFRVFINPKITRYSQKTVPMYEGCGSIFHGNLFGEVSRPKNVDVEYTDENGDQHKERFRGLLARVVQHEYDHIEGILFTERMTDLRTLMDKEHYLKMVKGK